MIRRLAHLYFVLLFTYFAPNVNAQPAPCDQTDGPGLAGCVERAYPDRLAANVSLIERQANLAFLRDRLIETARCSKVDAGHNCKRGNCRTLSLDFIAVRENGVTFGVDFAGHSDDVTRTLDLGWHTYGPPNHGYPTFKAYGPVSCMIEPPPDPPAPPFDPTPLLSEMTRLSEAVNILRTDNAALRTQLAVLRTQFANLEQAIPQIESRVLWLEQNPVPAGYTCSGRIAFGIPVRCTVTAEVDP